MAGNAVVGALRVVLGADTASLEDGLKKASVNVDAFAKSAAKAGAAIGAAMVAVGAAIGLGIKHAVDDADKLGKMAQKVGVPVEELSKLRLAADLSGISMESLSTAMGKLSKNMVEAANKPTSEAALAFKALGISVKETDGTMKSSSAVISDVAGKFENMKDGVGKTAVSMALFGKSGKDMIPLLNSGRDGLKDAADEAERFGIVISTRTAKAAELFNDNLTRLGKVKDGIILQITEHLLPDFVALSSRLVQLAKDSNFAKTAADNISGGFQNLISVGLHLSLIWQRLGAEWKALDEFLKTDVFSGKVAENWNKFIAAGEETQRKFIELKASLDLSDPIGRTDDALRALGPQIKKAGEEFNHAALTGKNAIDSFLDSQTKRIAGMKAEVAAFGQSAGVKERLALVEQTLATAAANNTVLTEAQRAKMVELGFATENYKLKLAGLKLEEEVMPPLQRFNEELERNRQLFDAGVISAEAFGRKNQLIAQNVGMTWDQMGASLAGTMSTIAGAFSKENKTMATASKAFAIVQATLNAYVASSKAFATLPPPASYVAAAAALAQGFATVMKIRSTAIGGFATGGSFTVPGSGGIDSQQVSMNVTPGERVDIWRPGETTGDPRGGGQPTTIRVTTDEISRPIVEKLIRGLNEAFRDGHSLKLAVA